MSAVLPHPADHGHDHDHDHDHAHGHPVGWRRWVFATNHKDIGTLYLLFAFTMFLVGGTLALLIRLELFQPGLQFFNPELFNQFTTMHGLIMVFGAIMPAFVGFANWMIPMQIGAAGHGLRAHEQPELLAADPGGADARGLVLHARWRPRGRLDALRAAHAADGPVDGRRHLRDAPDGRQLHHGLDQHHRHHPQHARARHDADEDADVRLDLADHRVPADRRDARARPAPSR